MGKIEATTRNESGYQFESRVNGDELLIDAVGDAGPGARHSLLATYASCFTGSCRLGAQNAGIDDIGKLRTHAIGTLDEDDHFASISFDIQVEADLTETDLDTMLARAKELCHLHDAVREDLMATIEIQTNAF